jgi:hypothetical protein
MHRHPEPRAWSPDDLRALERLLSSIQFRPRASLGPELEILLRHSGHASRGGARPLPRLLELGGLALMLCFAIYLLWATLLRGAFGL